MTMGGHQSAAMQSDVWLTPPEIICALGAFDLDPCAPVDRPWDTATSHYTVYENGLSCPWFGRVWLNPPYSREAVKWLERMADHGSGTALVFARTETDWFWRTVWNAADAVMFLRGRLHFYRPCGTRASANAGAPSVLVAYGRHDEMMLRHSGLNGRFISLRREAMA